ncbi:MAG: kelch repeat-containing protein [Thermoproteota archaeon]|nr:kelch repeat-containing protein [Thermoproteota archaeon]
MRKSFTLLLIALFLISGVVIGNTVSGAIPDMDTWVSKEPMPTARTYLGAAEVNGKIYAIGGFTDLNNTEEYDPTTDTWTIKAAMPTPRFGFAIVVYQSKIYCMGGLTGRGWPFASSVTGAIEVYDPTTNAWEIKKPMPTARAHLEACVINDQIYVIGGRTGGPNSAVSTNQIYDPTSEIWETKKPMPYPVASFSSTVVGNKIYVLGGQDDSDGPKNLDVTQIYDSTTDSWSIGTPMPTTVLNSAACTVSDPLGYEDIYLIGGKLGAREAGGNRTDMVQVLNTENHTWSVGVSILTAHDGLAVAVVNNTIYAMGGAGGNILSSGEGSAVNEAYTITPSPTPTVNHSPHTPQTFPVLFIALILLAVVITSFLLFRKHQKSSK